MRNVKSSYWSKALSSIPLFKRQTFPEALDYAVFLLITILAIIVLCSGCKRQQANSVWGRNKELNVRES